MMLRIIAKRKLRINRRVLARQSRTFVRDFVRNVIIDDTPWQDSTWNSFPYVRCSVAHQQYIAVVDNYLSAQALIDFADDTDQHGRADYHATLAAARMQLALIIAAFAAMISKLFLTLNPKQARR